MPIIKTELNILYIESAEFLKIDKNRRVVFRLFLNSDDQLTLAAWTAPDTDYDDNKPLFTLKVKGKSGFKWKKDTFFGDQKIGMEKIQTIRDEIKKTSPPAPHVIFIPQKHDVFSNQIAFMVNVGEIDKTENLTSIGLTNPSPPRNSASKE